MGPKRQPTLMESWKDKGPPGAVTPSRPASTTSVPTPSSARSGGNATTVSWRRGVGQRSVTRTRGKAESGRGRGRGQSRGRGRGNPSKFSSKGEYSFFEDEEDDICCQAVGQFELEASDVCKAFESANAATDLPGFDETAGQIWIYPTNRPIRDYQFQIVQTALFNNTLVSLPTGLGKTFIAAVVMYNFHRWYPEDLIIFMAPTRPLVTQQLEACHNIVGIHPSKTVELTGHISPKKREELWKTKSVFFLTPQVMTSDLTRGVCPADKVRCVVVDEAHKALGQHAYAQVIAMLSQKNTLFRVLALSATPGSDLAAVQQVFKNLLISRVELRSEHSSDILPYIHNKQVDKVVVQLDDYLKSVHERLLEVYQMYTGKLLKQNVIQGRDGSSLTAYQLLKAREVFREKMAPKFPNYQKGYIEVDFATCISLSHCIDLLLYHGLRCFYKFLQGIFNKEKGNPAVTSELKKNSGLQELLTELQQKLNITAENSSLNLSTSNLFTTFSKGPDTSFSLEEDNQTDYLISHPKMKVLKDIIIHHFKSYEIKNETTRVMIFSQFRDSVQEIGTMLSYLGPLVKPMVFIGQAKTGGGKGLKQKDQVQVVQRFRDGGFNVLISTCVGEEGLDIGEVDLIICFDASKSPTRLVQRMGRTGRQRKGRIIFLLTKGKEERSYSAGFSLQNSISKNITDPSKLYPYLYKFSPRMVPVGIQPECFKMSVVLTSEQESGDRKDDVIIVEDEMAKDGFSKPVNPAGRQKKVSAKSKKVGNRPPPAGSTTHASSSSERTIVQCFDAIMQKGKEREKRIVRSASPDRNVQLLEDPNDLCILEEHGLHNYVAADNNDNDLLCEIFDVVDASRIATNPCLNIPKPPKPINWLSEYNNINKEAVLLSSFDLECFKERLESYRLVMSFKEKCHCGNVVSSQPDSSEQFVTCYEDFQDRIFNIWGTQSDFPPNNPASSIFHGSAVDMSRKVDSVVGHKEFTMDEGFIIDEDDPFFDDEWSGDMKDCDIQVPESIVKEEKTERRPLFNHCENLSPIPVIEESFSACNNEFHSNIDIDNDSSTTSNDDFGSPVLRYQPISSVYLPQNPSPVNKSQCQASAPGKNCISTTPPLFDDSSTTSNDETFQSPFRKSNFKQINSPSEKKIQFKKESQTKSQVDRDLFKDDMLLFEDDEDFEEDFESPYASVHNVEDAENIIAYEAGKSQVSSPQPEIQDLEFIQPDVSSPKSSQKSEASDLSPDLSQFRVENRNKRIKLDETNDDLFVELSQKLQDTSNDNSVAVLNQYLEEQRQKDQEEEFKKKLSKKFKSPTNTQRTGVQASINLSLAENRTAKINNCKPEELVPTPVVKKKFTFKKKSPKRIANETHRDSDISAASVAIVSSVSAPTCLELLSDVEVLEVDKTENPSDIYLSSKYDKTVNFKENVIPKNKNLAASTASISTYTGNNAPTLSKTPSLSVLDDDDWIDMSNKDFRTINVPSSKPTNSTKRPYSEQTFLGSSGFGSSVSNVTFGGNSNEKRSKNSKKSNYVESKSKHVPGFLQNRRTVKDKSIESNNTSPAFKMPLPRYSHIVLTDDDDDFAVPRAVTPKRKNSRLLQKSVTPNDDMSYSARGNTASSSVFSSSPLQTSSSKGSGNRRRRKKRKIKGNPFLDLEADVSDDGSCSSVDEEDEFEGLDDFDDSFVVHEASDTISDSQQIRYIKSVRDIEPVHVSRVGKPLLPIFEANAEAEDGDYESDSFCIANDEDVEMAEIGVFTQAMNVAREEIMKENPSSAKRRQTRRHVKEKQAMEQQVILSRDNNSNSSSSSSNNKKRRRRIIFNDSSDDE